MTSLDFDMSDDLLAPTLAPSTSPLPATSSASILVLATQAAAADGSYQTLVGQLATKGKVDMYMLDRIVDGGELLSPLPSVPPRRARAGGGLGNQIANADQPGQPMPARPSTALCSSQGRPLARTH